MTDVFPPISGSPSNSGSPSEGLLLSEDPLQLAEPVDVEQMLLQLQDGDPNARMRAARAFCDVEDPRAVDRLIELLADPCLLVRVSAAYALGRNSNPSTVDPLIHALQRDWNGYVRKGIVWALGNTPDPRGIPVLIEALQTDIGAVRLWAASALGQLAQGLAFDPDSPNPVLEMIVLAISQGLYADPIPAVRSNCAWALGNLAQPWGDQLPQFYRVIKGLIRSMKTDPDLGVQDDARLALEKIGDPKGLKAIEDQEWE